VRRLLGTAVAAGLVCGLLSGSSASAETAGGGTPRWTASYAAGTPAETMAVAVSPDGSAAVVTGWTGQPSRHIATLAYDATTGAEKWTAEYPSPDQVDRYAFSNVVSVSPDGSTAYVGGWTSCTKSCDGNSFDGWVVLAFDLSSGTRLWVAKLAGAGYPHSLTTSPDGTQVYVAGTAEAGESVATAAYDATTGDRLWVASEDNQSGQTGGIMSMSPDGSRLYTVSTVPGDGLSCFGGMGFRTTAYDAGDGSPVWSKTYQIPSDYQCGTPSDVGVSPDGATVYVAGTGGPKDDGFRYQEADIVAYDAETGDQLWATKDDSYREGDGDDIGPWLAVDPGGSRVYLAGDRCTSNRACDATVMAYDAGTGVRQWVSPYDGGGRGYVGDLGVSPDGDSLFITGQWTMPCLAGCTSGEVDAPLVAFDSATGDLRWATTYHGNYGKALAVSPDSRSVYLAGSFSALSATSKSAAAQSCSGQCGYATARFNTGPGAGKIEESATSTTYDGWRGFYDKTAVSGVYRASRQAGATVRFRTPKATSVSWLTHLGPDQGEARVFLDGHDQGVVDLYAATPSAHRFTFDGLAKVEHRLKVKVLGRATATSSGSWVGVDGFRYNVRDALAQESASTVHYDGWAGHASASASGGTYRITHARGSSISLDFKGRSIRWVTALGPRFGKARVVIDGKASTHDLSSPKRRWRYAITFGHLPKGEHHLSIRALHSAARDSSRVVVDALVVRRH